MPGVWTARRDAASRSTRVPGRGPHPLPQNRLFPAGKPVRVEAEARESGPHSKSTDTPQAAVGTTALPSRARLKGRKGPGGAKSPLSSLLRAQAARQHTGIRNTLQSSSGRPLFALGKDNSSKEAGAATTWRQGPRLGEH